MLEGKINTGYDSENEEDFIKIYQFFSNNSIKPVRNNVSDIDLVDDKLNVIFYFNHHNYVKIIEIQTMTGAWDEKILRFTIENSLNNVKNANKQVKNHIDQDAVWFTLIAVKILRTFFGDDAPKYMLVERKALRYLR